MASRDRVATRRDHPRKVGGQFYADVIVWAGAVFAAQVLRYDLHVEELALGATAVLAATTAIAQLAIGWATNLYRARHPRGSLAELQALVLTVALVAVVTGVPVLVAGESFMLPRSTILIAAPIAALAMGTVRYARRLVADRQRAPGSATRRTLVFGAGDLGATLIRRMKTDPESRYLPVGILDDDPGKQNMSLHGVRVLGTRSDLAQVAREVEAAVLVVTIARADARLLTEVADLAVEAGLTVRVLPPFEQVLAGQSRLGDLRDVSIDDLIGRHPIDTRVEEIAGYVEGRRILVTGAGGSIGSELCRQLWGLRPAALVMLDRDETALQSIAAALTGGFNDDDLTVLADIRDAETLNTLFERLRPEVVFHAAALKHLPMLQRHPGEAWKTNVLGTLNVLKAATLAGTETFVNVSTDKAANPSSVLGHSKRAGERLTAWAAAQSGKNYSSVRFGNVLGSRGSIVPVFTALIESGRPLTVTHPDATRYFMSISEACQLVIQAGGIGRDGEVLLLDMGEPVRILDLAQRMIELSGRDVGIVYTGLRPGEKLHEDLIGLGEEDVRRINPRISHASVPPLDPADLREREWLERTASAADDATDAT